MKTGQREGFTASFLGVTRNVCKIFYRIQHWHWEREVRRRSGARRQLEKQGPEFLRGINEREERRGGGSKRLGCPSLRAAVTR